MASTPATRLTGQDLEQPLHCLCFGVRRTARALTQAYDAALAPAGLTVSQFSVLFVISLAAPTPMRRLAALLGMDRTTLTRALRPLLRDGLLRRVEGEDRRERRLALTPAGQERLEAALPRWRKAQKEVAGRFGSSRSAALLGELSQLRLTLGVE